MNKEELKTTLEQLLPSPAFEEGTEWVTVVIDPVEWGDIARRLRSADDLAFDYLFCVTAIDWKTHFTMVYHLTSTIHRHTIVVKSKLDRINPEIETVSDIWRTAEFHEREVYDLFGVKFIHHPDMRR